MCMYIYIYIFHYIHFLIIAYCFLCNQTQHYLKTGENIETPKKGKNMQIKIKFNWHQVV